MAFNLNKNDEQKKSSSAFNLSKQPLQEVAKPVQTSKNQSSGSKTWLIGIGALIILGVGSWYYVSLKDSASHSPGTTSESIAATPVNVEVIDSTNTHTQSVPASTENKAEALPNEKTTIKATLDGKIPVRFASGSSSFRNMDQPLIKRLIFYLKDNPEASIQVYGYASSEGSIEVNQIISQARADAFKKFLISKNVQENRITALGKGIENPIASNESNSERKKNRRIEVNFPN